MQDLSGKTVWVTGASSGIGEALARAFYAAGANLVLSARREEALDALAESLGDRAHVVPLDVADTDAVPGALLRAEALAGPIDVLVNNAGISQRSYAQDTSMVVYRRLMDVNYFGAVALTQAVVPGMLARGAGQIVQISSVAGKLGAPQRTGYCASKHALIGYSDALRAEVHDLGVHVLVVCPGYVNTPLSYAALAADGGKHNQADDDLLSGISPELVADKTLEAIRAGKHELLVGGKEIQAVRLKRLAPNLVAKLTRRVAARQRQNDAATAASATDQSKS